MSQSLQHSDALSQLIPIPIDPVLSIDLQVEGSSLDQVVDDIEAMGIAMFPDMAGADEIVGLEELCSIASDDGKAIEDRRAAVISRLRDRGDLSIPGLIARLESAGYRVAGIEEHAPLMAGIAQCGDNLTSIDGLYMLTFYIAASGYSINHADLEALIRNIIRGTCLFYVVYI